MRVFLVSSVILIGTFIIKIKVSESTEMYTIHFLVK